MNACIFPGQGSQSVGMLDAWGDHPAVRDTLAEASEALGQDLGQLIAQGPAEALALTTQHPTRDAGGRCRRLPGLVGRGWCDARLGRWALPR